jgi:type I restriction enzyme M protein
MAKKRHGHLDCPLFVGEGAPELRPVHDLRSRLKDIHNYLYANDRFKQRAKVFEELMKLLFAKVYDEKSRRQQFQTSSTETPEACAARVRQLFRAAAADVEMAGVFSNDATLELSPRSLAYAVLQLQAVSLAETDAKGAAFQSILGPQVRGEKGQFFTPDPVKRLIVEIIDPQVTETVLDPATGSAGLLAVVIDHVQRAGATKLKASRTTDELTARQRANLYEDVGRYAREHVLGVEIDPVLVRVARLNMLIHGDGHSRIFAGDALSPWKELSPATRGVLAEESVDIVVTNPPFGTKGKVDEPRILAAFPHVTGGRARQVPDILFLERIVQVLRPGGRAGVVLPYGDLANSSLLYVRDFLRETCHIFAVVSLPLPTFKPAENSVKAAVLFIRKWPGRARPARTPTFRAICRKIGYDMHERVTYLRDANGLYLDRENRPLPPLRAKDPGWLAAKGVVDEDVSNILNEWAAFRARHKEYLW